MLYSKAINRKVLNYYPVDFFQTGKNFNKLFEKKYKHLILII